MEDYGQFGPVLAGRKLGSGLSGFDTFKIKKTSRNLDAGASGMSQKGGRDTVRIPANKKGISSLRQDSIKSRKSKQSVYSRHQSLGRDTDLQ